MRRIALVGLLIAALSCEESAPLPPPVDLPKPRINATDPLSRKALAACEALQAHSEGRDPGRSLHDLLTEIATPANDAAGAVIRAACIEPLLTLFDAGKLDKHDRLNALRQFIRYNDPGGLQRAIKAAKDGEDQDNFLWLLVLRGAARYPSASRAVAKGLTSPLPPGRIRIGFAMFCYDAIRRGTLKKHPLDSEDGRAAIEEMLTDASHGSFAAATLALMGDERGVEILVKQSTDPNHAMTAQQFLRELRLTKRIPDEARAPDNLAKAKLVDWLKRSIDHNAPPDTLEVKDMRQMYWPPTKDVRTVWLLEYGYKADGGMRHSVGFVGAEAHALANIDPTLPAKDIYGLYCAQALAMGVTVDEGRRCLKQAAPK